jgi:hypothetical protein
MRWKERLYERPLTRALDEQIRNAIEAELERRRPEVPVPFELTWKQGKQSLAIASKWFTFLVHFANDRMVVDAELSLAARMFATEQNRKELIALIVEVADELKL